MANKVFVAVVPDTRGFREDLLKRLRTIEKIARVNVKLGVDADGFKTDLKATVEQAQANLDRNPVLLNVNADIDRAKEQMRKVAKDLKVTVNADADTKAAAAQLAIASRARRVDFVAKLNKAALAKVGSQLAAFSGLKGIKDLAQGALTSLSNLPQSLPKIAAVALAIGSLAAVSLSATSGLVTAAAAVGSLAALAAPLPGLLAAAGVAAITMAIALQGAGEQLKSLNPKWKQLQTTIQTNFWAKAKQPILDLVNGVFPQLQSGLDSVSSSLGVWAGSVAGSFQKAFGGDVLNGMFGKLSEAIRNSIRGTDSFAKSIATLGTFGANYLPAIGDMFSDLAIRFNKWIEGVVSNGQLAAWVDSAVSSLSDLGGIAKGTIGIISGLAKAASASGGSGLATLGKGLQDVAAIINGAKLQTALSTLFSGAAKGATGLLQGLKPIGDLLSNLAPTLSTALTTLGTDAGKLIGGIADALNQPTVENGIGDFISGISEGIKALLPSLPALGEAFGAIASVAGTLGATLGPVFAEAIKVLAPAFADLLEGIKPLIPILGQGLVDAIKTIAPQLPELVDGLVKIAQVATDLAINALPVVTLGLQLAVGAFKFLSDAVDAVSTPAGNLTGAMSRVASAMVNGASVVGVVTGVLNGVFGPGLQNVAQIAYRFGATLRAVFNSVVSSVRSFASSVQAGAGAVAAVFAQLPGRIIGALSRLSGQMVSIGSQIIAGLVRGVAGGASAVASAISGVAAGAIAKAKSVLGIHSPSRVFAQLGRYVVQGFSQGITGSQAQVQRAMQTLSNKVVDAFNSTGTDRKLLKAATATTRAVYSNLTTETRAITAGQRDAALESIAKANDRLQSLAARRVTVANKLKAAQKVYAAAVKTVQDFKKKALSSLGTFDITSVTGADAITGGLKDQIAQVKAFASTLAKLRKAGLDKTSYQQFIAKGVDSLPQAQDLLASGKKSIKTVAKLQGQLGTASNAFASSAANDMYGAGVQAAKGLIDGLKSQQKALAATMVSIASALVKTIKSQLGIHSPSRVFRDQVGKQIVLGTARGVIDNKGVVTTALAQLVNVPSIPDVSSVSAGSSSQSPVVQIINKTGVALTDLIDARIQTADGWAQLDLVTGLQRGK